MADDQVTFITKPNVNNFHEHITHLGNPVNQWRWTREQVISSVDTGNNTFYIIDSVSTARTNIEVLRELGRMPLLRTYANDKQNNNLLPFNHRHI